MAEQGRRLPAPKVGAGFVTYCWRGASLDMLSGAIAGGSADALGELLHRRGRPAVDAALAALLESGGDEPLMLDFLRGAAAYAVGRYPVTKLTGTHGKNQAMCDHARVSDRRHSRP